MEQKLKKGVDHVGICIVYFCHDGQGKFIMAKRSQNSRDEQGRWDIGGGAVELHDTVENTIRSEAKQEYSTDVLGFEFLGYRDVHREHDGNKTHWIALDFKVLIDPTTVKIGEPHKFDDIGWFTLNTLPSEVHSQFPTFLKLYREKL